MWNSIRRPLVAALLAVAFADRPRRRGRCHGAHALSMFDDVKYDSDFTHFDYVEPKAPAGGSIRLAALGTYDSLNPFILRGTPQRARV